MKGLQVNRLVVVVAALAGVGICSQSCPASTFRILSSFDLPFPQGDDLDITWDGQYLWTLSVILNQPAGDSPSATVRALDPSRGGLVVSSFNVYGDDHQGLTWHAASLWVTNTSVVLESWGYGTLADSLPDSIDAFSDEGIPKGSVPSPNHPDALATGIVSDGTYLWVADRKHRQIAQVDPSDGGIVASFWSPGKDPDSLAWDGRWLWCLDRAEKVVYQLDTTGSVRDTWHVPSADPTGITFADGSFWILDDAGDEILHVVIPEPPVPVGLIAGLLVVVLYRSLARRSKACGNGRGSNGIRGTPYAIPVV